MAIVEREFVAQVADRAEIATDTADEAIGVALMILGAGADVIVEAEHQEGRRTGCPERDELRACRGSQERVVDAEPRVEAPRDKGRLDRLLGRIDPDELGLEKWLKGVRNLGVEEDVADVAREARKKHRILDAGSAQPADHTAADPAVVDERHVGRERPVGGEGVVARDQTTRRGALAGARGANPRLVCRGRAGAGRQHVSASRDVAKADARNVAALIVVEGDVGNAVKIAVGGVRNLRGDEA